MMQPILIFTQCDTSEEAEEIADAILNRTLAAAVQIIGPISSRYRWQDKIHKKQEWLVMIKTNDSREGEIKRLIRELHSYELPGILKLNIAGGERQYLQWILDQSGAGIE